MEPLSTLPYDAGDFPQLLPIAIPALFGLVVLCLDLFLDPKRNKTPLALINGLACALTAFAALVLWTGDVETVVLGGSLVTSSFTCALALACLLGTTLIGFATAHHGGDGYTLAHGELYGLMLFGTSGMLALCAANDLVTFFVALETLSICVYALTGADRRRARSAEGAMKYFILGAFSSGFLLYGMSLIYGATGTMVISGPDGIGNVLLAAGAKPLATTGGVLLLIGLLFKIGAIPFHAWVPDAYEGAPSAVTGYMSIGVKVAAFGGALHVLTALAHCGAIAGPGIWAIWLIAAITVIAGNAGALTQRNPRRLLAYSGIAHTGYLLIGVVAVLRDFAGAGGANAEAAHAAALDAGAGILFYLVAYAAANAGVFAVLCHLERKGNEVDSITDLAGLSKTHPGSALVMTISLVSLAGIPGTAGFLGKLWVFRAGIAAGDIGLVLLALLASAISLYYYLYVVVVMYMHGPVAGTPGATQPDEQRWASRLAVGTAGLLTVGLGVWPAVTKVVGIDLLQIMVDGAKALLTFV